MITCALCVLQCLLLVVAPANDFLKGFPRALEENMLNSSTRGCSLLLNNKLMPKNKGPHNHSLKILQRCAFAARKSVKKNT